MVTKKRVEAMKSETEANAQGTKGHGKETRTHIDRFGLKQETNILLAQPELTENRTARGTDTKEIENKHSSRLVGGAETGSRSGEDLRGRGRTQTKTKTGRAWDGRGGQSDHWQTLWAHIRADKQRGPDSEWWRTGQAERWVAPHGPTFTHRKTRQTAGSKADHTTQGSSARGNKASNL